MIKLAGYVVHTHGNLTSSLLASLAIIDCFEAEWFASLREAP